MFLLSEIPLYLAVGLGESVDPADSGLEGYRESRRCSRETYPVSYITKYTSIRRNKAIWFLVVGLGESVDPVAP